MAQAVSSSSLVSLYRRLAPVLRQSRGRLLGGGVFIVLASATTLVYPQIVRIVVDEAVLGGELERLNPLAILMLGILLVEGAALWALYLLYGKAARSTVESLREGLVEHLMEQEIAFFDRESSTQLMARIMGDIGQIREVLARSVPDAIRQVFFLVGGLVLVVQTSPLLAGAVALIWPPIYFGSTALGNRVRRAGTEVQTAESHVAQSALEALGGIRTVRSYAQERAEADRVRRFVHATVKRAQRGIKAEALLQGFAKVTTESGMIVGLWVGGWLIASGAMTTGALVSFILYAGLVVRSTRNLTNFMALVHRIHGTTEHIFSYLDRETKMPLEGGVRLERVDGQLCFDDVRFHYDARGGDEHPHGLEGIDLTIERGEEIAIVGASGSGKSTLMRLAARFYDPDSGTVRLDGHDLRELDPSWLRQHVTFVAQDSSLFSRSIDENLRFGREDADPHAVATAIELTGAKTLVESQPEGLETDIGDHGARLSGGQRQRIALARALLCEPPVLILDEATSALDAESEARIKEGLRKLAHRPTVIWIAPRLSTVVDVGRVLVIDRGRLVADGTHAELMQSSNAYRELVETQLVSE
jgi:ATP-binding cassette subfamily B protein